MWLLCLFSFSPCSESKETALASGPVIFFQDDTYQVPSACLTAMVSLSCTSFDVRSPMDLEVAKVRKLMILKSQECQVSDGLWND